VQRPVAAPIRAGGAQAQLELACPPARDTS
jgi:hypothetical protein